MEGNKYCFSHTYRIENFGICTVTHKIPTGTQSAIIVTPIYTVENKKKCKSIDKTFEVVVKPATIIESIEVNARFVSVGGKLKDSCICNNVKHCLPMVL